MSNKFKNLLLITILQHILKKIETKKREKIEINTRNSRFNQRRMQTLAHLGSEVLLNLVFFLIILYKEQKGH